MCHLAIPAVIGTGLQLINSAADVADDGDEARKQAKQLAARGAHEATLVRQDNARQRARHRVAMMKGGVTDSGSPTDSLLDLAQEGERSAYWAKLGYDQEARARLRKARRAGRSGLLQQLSGVNNLGEDLIRLDKTGDLKWP